MTTLPVNQAGGPERCETRHYGRCARGLADRDKGNAMTDQHDSSRAAATRTRLLEAAVTAFAEKGFHATTTRDIAAAAGMSPAALYVHHKSKEELLHLISREGHSEVLGLIRAGVPPPPPRAMRSARCSTTSPRTTRVSACASAATSANESAGFACELRASGIVCGKNGFYAARRRLPNGRRWRSGRPALRRASW